MTNSISGLLMENFGPMNWVITSLHWGLNVAKNFSLGKMMKKIVIIAIFLFLLLPPTSITTWAKEGTNLDNLDVGAADASLSERRKQILKINDEELKETNRLSKQLRHNDPNLLLRIAELFLEKARLMQEEENEQYLKINPSARVKVDKKKLHENSMHFFKEAQKTGEYILKKHPNFDKRGEVYYILAFNAKEFGDMPSSKKFFQLAAKHAPPNSGVSNRANLALAEMLISEEKYQDALQIYQRELRDEKDKWWTKDAYNYAWACYRVNRHDQSIELFRKIYDLSKKGQHVDMSSATLNVLALVYADAGRIEEGFRFYESQNHGMFKYLLRMSRQLQEKGEHTKAERILEAGIKIAKTPQDEKSFLIPYLDISGKYDNFEKHLMTALKLKKMQEAQGDSFFDSDEKQKIVSSIQKMSSVLQKQLVDRTYEEVGDIKEQKGKMVSVYLDLLAYFQNKDSEEISLVKGENYYLLGKYWAALEAYVQCSGPALKKGPDNKFLKLCSDGILSVLDNKKFDINAFVDGDTLNNDPAKRSLLLTAYQRYLLYLKHKSNPALELKIYQRLFSLYYKEGKIKECEEILNRVRSAHPKEIKIQESMAGLILDFFKKNKDQQNLERFARRIESGEVLVAAEYRKKVSEYLLAMKFKSVEESSIKGDKNSAINGYIDIFEDKQSSSMAKRNAAYNITLLYYEIGNMDKTYWWGEKAISMMESSEIVQFEPTWILITTEMFHLGFQLYSANLAEKLLDKLCIGGSTKTKIFYKNGIVMLLAENKLEEAIKLFQLGRTQQKCKIPEESIREMAIEINKSYLLTSSSGARYESFERFLRIIDNGQYLPTLLKSYGVLRNAYIRAGRHELANDIANNKILKYYQNAKKSKVNLDLDDLEEVADIRCDDLAKFAAELRKLELRFPEADYNRLLQQKLQMISELTKRAMVVFEVGSGIGSVRAYIEIIRAYDELATEIETFNPGDRAPEYVKNFKEAMISLAAPLRQKASEYRQEATSIIKKNSILSINNGYFLLPDQFKRSVIPQYFGFDTIDAVILMDRKGGE
ncbi:MAG: hypothetical protein HQK50_01515 [Oligoflexia bacterium]|nr:hypothetical protein [Oligoflexia bacterium]